MNISCITANLKKGAYLTLKCKGLLSHCCTSSEQSQVHIIIVLVIKMVLNKNVLRFFLKILKEELFLMCVVVAFHSVGAAL